MFKEQLAIKVDNIGKRYRIGVKENQSDSIIGIFLDLLKSPLRNYRRYRSLYKFNEVASDIDLGKNNRDETIVWALKDVSFEIKKGEVVGIIGRNGAGKSTLLKVLCKITDPSVGVAKIRGRVSSLLEVGTGFHPELTGRENVYLNGTILGMTKREVSQKFDEIVEFADVGKFIDTPVKRYSSGMRVRLGFAVAAYLEPEILIIDEVLAVGDATFQKKCLNKMQNVGQRGRTVLFVSHNMSAVTRLCDRTILLDEGRLIDDGPSTKVVKTYLNSGFGTMAAREWNDIEKAPTGDAARLRAVRIKNKDGEISDAVNICERVALEMDYEVFDSGYELMPFFHVFNEEGIEVFDVHDTSPEWRDRNRPAGHYRSTAWIPGNLLAEGTLYISAGLVTLHPYHRQFFEHSAVGFQVVEDFGSETARGKFAGKMTGIIRPLLEWQTEYN
jgi:homopolymeric O-antigen transport system ATP-binding protein